MAGKRVVLDCRGAKEAKGCTVTIAGTESEVLDLGMRHAVERHGFKDTPQSREELRSYFKEEAFAGR